VKRGGPDECWPWTASTRGGGYGQIARGGLNNGMFTAHRVAWELLRGPIPAGYVVDHLCKNPRCCNPNHLEPVPERVNLMRGDGPAAQAARKTHCPQGHPYDEANTHISAKGYRQCRECGRRKQNPHYIERQRAYVPKPRKVRS
jgi:hypothetical protein